MNKADQNRFLLIMKEFDIPASYKEAFLSHLETAKESILLSAIMNISGGKVAADRFNTDETRLKKFLHRISYNKHDVHFDSISLRITIGANSIETMHPGLTMAVFKQLNRIHTKAMGKESSKPPSMRTTLLRAFQPLASFLYKEKALMHKGIPSKNKIAKLVERVLQEYGIDNISLQQITKSIF